jgi:hypothetical protein
MSVTKSGALFVSFVAEIPTMLVSEPKEAIAARAYAAPNALGDLLHRKTPISGSYPTDWRGVERRALDPKV